VRACQARAEQGLCQELWCVHRDNVFVQDITFLHRAVVEAPGDTGGMCPEAAAPPFALLSRDAREATVYPATRIVGTHFPDCVKEGRRPCYFMLCLAGSIIHK